MLRFNDGVNIDTSGKLRVARYSDGYYVVGNGVCCAVDTWFDGQLMVLQMELKVDKVLMFRVNDDASIMCGELVNEVLVIKNGSPLTLYVNEMYEVQWDVSGHTYNPEER
jgi:hypothetical protein